MVTTLNQDLFDRIARAAEQPPETAADVEALFGIAMAPVPTGTSEQEFRSSATTGGIEKARLRLPERSGHKSAVLSLMLLPETAPTRDEVEAAVSGLTLERLPRGRSLKEEVVIGKDMPWGRLSFGFAARDRNRLRSVYLYHPNI